MTPEAAVLMRHNFRLCAQQMDGLAEKAKSEADADQYRRAAETYRRLLRSITEPSKGGMTHTD